MRQRLLALVQARLERFGVDHNPATVLDPEAVAELTALLETVPDPAADLEIARAAGWLHWCRYLVLDPGDDQQDLDDALAFFLPVYQTRPDAVPDQVRTHFGRPAASDDPQAVADRAVTLVQETLRTGDRAALDAAIDLLRQAVAAIPAGHPGRARYLSNLGVALQVRFERAGDRADLDAAIDAGAAGGGGHPGRPPRPRQIPVQPRHRPARPGLSGPGTWPTWTRRSTLRQAVAAIPPATPTAPDTCPTSVPPCRPGLSGPGTWPTWTRRSTAAGRRWRPSRRTTPAAPRSCPTSASPCRPGLSGPGTGPTWTPRSTPASRRWRPPRPTTPTAPSTCPTSASPCEARFERTGDLADLDAAIDLLRQAVAASPADHPDRARYLSNLGVALRARFERTGDRADLDAAVDAGRQAVAASPADHPDRALYLSNLGAALQIRFERTGDRADLDAAIDAGRQAVAASPGRPPRPRHVPVQPRRRPADPV